MTEEEQRKRAPQLYRASRRDLREAFTHVLCGNLEPDECQATYPLSFTLPTWITLLINSLVERVYSFQSPGFLFTHLFSSHSTQHKALHMADANYWMPAANIQQGSLEYMARYTWGMGARAHKFLSSPPPVTYCEDLQKWTKASALSFFCQTMKSLNAFYTRGLCTSTLLESMEQKQRLSLSKLTCIPTHWLCFLLAGWPCHVI